MTLLDAIEYWNRSKAEWTDGFNFKNKSKFIGIENEQFILTRELLESNKWGICVESHDKEFNAAFEGLINGTPDREANHE